MRLPWRKKSFVDEFFDWVHETRTVLERYDPVEAARFRDLVSAFFAEHADSPPTKDEFGWFIDRSMSYLRVSMDRLDVPMPKAER